MKQESYDRHNAYSTIRGYASHSYETLNKGAQQRQMVTVLSTK